jgi:beta-glucanase (GH16 family)
MGKRRFTFKRSSATLKYGRSQTRLCLYSAFVLTLLLSVAITISIDAPPAHALSWTLVWSDEFNGSGGVSADWIYDTGTGYGCAGCPGNWGTGEVETMSSSTTNVFQANGNLNIQAVHTGSNPTTGWTSGRIETARIDFQPPPGGAMAIEANLQQPDVSGTNGLGYWPAFWMLGAPFRGNYLNWPSVGEIDIMEDINGRSSEFATLHCGSSPGGPCNETSGKGSGERACMGCQTGFHTYRMEFDRSISPEEIRWYLDGANFFTVNSSQVDATTWSNATNHGFFILFDLAMGGGFPAAFGGGPNSSTISGGTMLVDYVRVFYSSAPQPSPTPSPLQLFLEQGAADPSQAAALDTQLFFRDPFPIVNPANLLNQGFDRNTRVTVFVANLLLAQGETASSVTVNLVDANNQSFDLAAEDVRTVPNLTFAQVIFRLPDNLAAGSCAITVKAHGLPSNTGKIRIRN